jgi:esterase/lipase
VKNRKVLLTAAIAAMGAGAILTAATVVAKAQIDGTLDELAAHSDNPAPDYDAAIASFAQIQAEEDDTINPLCRSKLMTHGVKAERVIVLVHGMTNCPQQFVEFAPLFKEQGYNVLIPRMPRHGLADRMTEELKYLTAEELRDCCNTMVDIARGLGDHVTFLGLSVGGSMAAWVAQHRSDVDKAVVIAPSIGFTNLGADKLTSFAIVLSHYLPNIASQYFFPFQDGPQSSYLGYSSRAIGEVMRLGKAISKSAKKEKPAAKSILVVTNAADAAVNSKMNLALVKMWRSHGHDAIEEYEFDADKKLIHDIIDPQQVQQQTALVYPILFDFITR